MQKMHNAISDKPVNYYSLDVVLAVGYRTSSSKAIRFRQWASTILKDHLIKGYSLNKKLLETKQEQIDEIRHTLDFLIKSGKNLEVSDPFLDILSRYTNSLITLNQFDEDRITVQQGVKGIQIEIDEFRDLIKTTKQELIAKQEATDLFGQEYKGKFESSIATIYQKFGGKELYQSLEEKCANLLYLIIKNHGFVDGNKRIGSILFVYYLAKNNYLYRSTGELKIDENTLVALALLVAQSKPEDKDILVKLIIKLIQE
jgi:death-on-curing family protein